MNILKVVSVLGVVAAFSACGKSSNDSVAQSPYGVNPYGQTGYIGPNGGTGSQPRSQIPGGFKILTPVLGGIVSLTDTYNLPASVPVNAGDLIEVHADNASVTKIGFFSVSSSLTQLNVLVNNVPLGSGSLYGLVQYQAQAAGTMTFTLDWQLTGSGGTHVVNFNGGGVFIASCKSIAGAAMPCPLGY